MTKVLFIRSPRYRIVWAPEYLSFQLPLGMCLVASALMDSMPDLDIEIIDCPAEKIGWKSIEKLIEEKKPDIVASGEPQSFYYHETVRLFDLVKKISPETITIAGGFFFSARPDFIFKRFNCIDYIIIGEAEISFSELIRALRDKTSPALVQGIAFKQDNDCRITSPRSLVENLDELPFPKYDLLPMGKYFWPMHNKPIPSAIVETSRGCAFDCEFCSLWYFWRKKNNEQIPQPSFRRKSVKRVIEEITICYEKFKIRYVIFPGSCFNYTTEWADEFCTRLFEKKYTDLHWFAYSRPEHIIRDERAGVLKKMVDCGLEYISMGAERLARSSVQYEGKSDCFNECTSIFREKYPQVTLTGTFLNGLPGDSYQELIDQSLYAFEKKLNAILPVLLLPFPGTTLYNNLVENATINESEISQKDYGVNHLLYRLGKKNKDFLFFCILCVNPMLINTLLYAYRRAANYKLTWIKKIIHGFVVIIYSNAITVILFNFITFILLLPMLMVTVLLRKSPWFSYWQWFKPRWYDK